MRLCTAALWAVVLAIGSGHALGNDAAGVQLEKVWAPAGDKGIDLPIYMTIANAGDADDLLRVECPSVAHFSEKRTVDYGEGAPAAREVRAIPVKAQGATLLQPGGYHLTLLKITNAVAVGDSFECQIYFRRSGMQSVKVSVANDDGQAAATR